MLADNFHTIIGFALLAMYTFCSFISKDRLLVIGVNETAANQTSELLWLTLLTAALADGDNTEICQNKLFWFLTK